MKRGFTLLEILIVLVIIGLFLGFAIPSIRSMQERNQLQTAAKEFRAQLGKVRLRAIETGQVFEVRYAPGTNQFQILSKPTIPRSIGDSDLSTLSSSGTTTSTSDSSSVTGGKAGGSSSTTSSISSGPSGSSNTSSDSNSTNSSVGTADSGGATGGSVSSGTGNGGGTGGGTTSEGVSYRASDLVAGRGLTLNSSGEIDPELVYLGASSVWFDDTKYRSELTEDETTTGVSGSGPTELKVSALSSSSSGSSDKSSSASSSEKQTSDDGGSSNSSISKVESGGVNTSDSEREIPLSEQLRRVKSDWPEPLGGTYSTTNATGSDETTADTGSGFTDWSPPILFFPNGRTSNATIRLWTRNNGYIEVTLRGATGQVTLSKPSRYDADLEALRQAERDYLTELRSNSTSDTGTATSSTTSSTTTSGSTSSPNGTGASNGTSGSTTSNSTTSGNTTSGGTINGNSGTQSLSSGSSTTKSS